MILALWCASHVMAIGMKGVWARVAFRMHVSAPGHIDDWRGRPRDPPLRHVALPFWRGLGIELSLAMSSTLSNTPTLAVSSTG